jgi:hypothetical protein
MNIAFTKSRIKAIISEEHDIMIREKETGPVSKGVHTVLDFIGLIPGWGEWADVLNAAIHAKEGNYLLASLSAISVIPVVGDAIGKGGKVTLKLRRLFPKAMKQVEKYAPEVVKGVRGLRATIQRNKGKIDKLLDLLEEEGHLSEYIDEIRMAINVLASSEETDESIAEKISGEMFKPDAAIWDDARLKTPDEEEIKASKGIRVAVSKKKDEEDEGDEGEKDAGAIASSSEARGSSAGFMTPFDSKGNIRPEFLKFEGSKIDDMIREEMNKLVIEVIEKNKKNLGKKKMREENLEEIVRLILQEGYMKKSYKRDGDEGKDKRELEEAELGDPNTNCTPGQPGQTCADAFNMGAISEDEGEDAFDIEDRKDPIDLDDDRLKDREHAYWVQDPKMWEAFEAFYKWQQLHPEGGLAVMPGTYEVLQDAKAALDDPEDSIEVIGPMARETRDRNYEFRDAIEDHDPATTPSFKAWTKTPAFKAWIKKLKENKMKESKKLTRSILKTILQEEFENIMSEDDEEGIETGVEDIPRLDALQKWFEGRTFDERQAWAATLADTDIYKTGTERVKVGVALGLGIKDLGLLANVELDSGMIAYVLKQSG